MTTKEIETKVRKNCHGMMVKGYWYDVLGDGKLYRIHKDDMGREWRDENGNTITGWEEVNTNEDT